MKGLRPSSLSKDDQQATGSAAHDAINRLLHRLEADPNKLWQEAKTYIDLEQGILVINDTMLNSSAIGW